MFDAGGNLSMEVHGGALPALTHHLSYVLLPSTVKKRGE